MLSLRFCCEQSEIRCICDNRSRVGQTYKVDADSCKLHRVLRRLRAYRVPFPVGNDSVISLLLLKLLFPGE